MSHQPRSLTINRRRGWGYQTFIAILLGDLDKYFICLFNLSVSIARKILDIAIDIIFNESKSKYLM